MLKKIELNISGMHCQSCKTLIETEIDVLAGVNKINVDYKTGKSEIEFDNKLIDENKIKKRVEKLGYKANNNSEDNKKQNKGQNAKKSYLSGLFILIALIVLVIGFFLVNRLGGFELLASLNEGNVGYGIIFIIGLLAGFHCVGMCGGLVVAYSASNLKNKTQQSLLPHFQYNLGRIVSYTIIGGVLGGIGSFFGINPIFSGIILLLASIFMILMGLSFLGNWQILEKVKLKTPESIARYLYNQKHNKKPKGPLAIGLLNGFMPCGPLQAIQLYALASGSIIQGALSLGIYAFGTAILMFFFGLTISSIKNININKMIKVSGVLIIILGLFMANRGLANFGVGINFDSDAQAKNITINNTEKFQEIDMELNYTGYKPNVLYIKKGIPVRWNINVTQMTGCTDAIMIESLGIKKDLKIGKNIIEFNPPENVSEIKFSCWMRMVWGKFIITDSGASPSKSSTYNEAKSLPTSGSCGGSCGSATCGAAGGGTCGCGAR